MYSWTEGIAPNSITNKVNIMSIKQDFYAACVDTNSLEELHAVMGSDDLGYLHEQDVKNGWEGLSFEDWKESIQEAILELSIEA